MSQSSHTVTGVFNDFETRKCDSRERRIRKRNQLSENRKLTVCHGLAEDPGTDKGCRPVDTHQRRTLQVHVRAFYDVTLKRLFGTLVLAIVEVESSVEIRKASNPVRTDSKSEGHLLTFGSRATEPRLRRLPPFVSLGRSLSNFWQEIGTTRESIHHGRYILYTILHALCGL